MWCPSKAKTRRLLCVLFLRLGPLSAGPGQTGGSMNTIDFIASVIVVALLIWWFVSEW